MRGGIDRWMKKETLRPATANYTCQNKLKYSDKKYFCYFINTRKRQKPVNMFNAHQLTSSRALEMLESGESSDCVIEVLEEQNDGQKKKTEFNVHKFVLIVNSDVFRAMFSHKNTKEFRENRIEICDSTATVVHQMLIYLYTGALPNEKYSVERDAVPLLQLAHKYQIKSLMDFNEQKLIDSLSLANVIERLELADVYRIDSLKLCCGQLIRQNLSRLKMDAKWDELKTTAPKLAFSVLEEFADESVPKQRDQQGSRPRPPQYPNLGTFGIPMSINTPTPSIFGFLPPSNSSGR